ncbi:putative protein-like [Capsicum annuum]|nr:putative protein-like [Capsicum annuum]
MVSIGPYHRKNPILRPMEKYKVIYLQRFLKRQEGLDLESCINELEELKEEELKCYDDIEDLKKDMSHTDQFLQMLLLDGCFVVEFIRELHKVYLQEEENIIDTSVGYIFDQLTRDLMLLENQLPFFVLNKLHHTTKKDDELPFAIMAKCCFAINLTKTTPAALLEHENGLLKIPCLRLFDSTESNLRNLIAFEQQSDVHHRYFSDYATFMDQLIELDKDVNLLR